MLYTTLILHIPGLSCLWWLFLGIIPLLMGLLLGYWLWHQYKERADALEVERDRYHAQFTDMEKKYASLKYSFDELEKDNKALRASLHAAEADVAVLKAKLQRPTEPEASGAFDFAALFPETNLEIVEGIGPKVEKVLKDAGIGTWGLLASKTPADLKEVLEKAGSAFRMQNPKTWPEQAALARDGKWADLVKYQKFLDTGREDKGDFETPAKIEVLAARLADAVQGTRDLGAPNLTGIFTPDNLQVIEGVGPKLEEVLKAAGFTDWPALADASPEQLSEALLAADPKYRIHDPKTWPEQAALARDGKWAKLIEYQKFLDTGRENKGDFETDAKVEKLAAKLLGFSGAKADNLKIVEGIGPKIEQLLKDAGIENWTLLANTSAGELKEILMKAGDRYRLAKPDTWPKQARLAAAGHWKELKEFQDFLQGGNDPGA